MWGPSSRLTGGHPSPAEQWRTSAPAPTGGYCAARRPRAAKGGGAPPGSAVVAVVVEVIYAHERMSGAAATSVRPCVWTHCSAFCECPVVVSAQLNMRCACPCVGAGERGVRCRHWLSALCSAALARARVEGISSTVHARLCWKRGEPAALEVQVQPGASGSVAAQRRILRSSAACCVAVSC